MDQTNITIIGAGAIGLATSFTLSKTHKDILVVEQHDSFGRETSSRNSEVIHAGIYYPKDSLKAKSCIKGKSLLYDLCNQHNIPHKKVGKLIVSCNDEESKKLEIIKGNAFENGIKNLRFLGSKEFTQLEPNIKAQKALFCPDTGIIDSHQLMKFFYEKSKQQDVDFAFNIKVISIEKLSSHYKVTVQEPSGEPFSFETKIIINAAGLFSDKIAQMIGINILKNRYKIHYSKGQYFRLANPKKFSINHLIYPPPSKTDLGIHVTPDLAGGLRLGPDAEYVDNISYTLDENDKEKFLLSVSRFLKNLSAEDLIPDTVGMRAKLQAPQEDFRDFIISEEKEKGFENFINLLGIESPGLTSCLAIAQMVENFL